MATINIATRISSSDPRSKEISCTLEIENRNAAAIQLLSVEPSVPHGVRIQDIFDVAIADRKRDYGRLCDELTRIYNNYLFATSEDFRNKRVEAGMEVLRQVLSAGAVTRSAFNLVRRSEQDSLVRIVNNVLSSDDAWKIAIKNAADGRNAVKGIADDYIRSVFEYKLSQLTEIEAALSEVDDGDVLCTIEPGSTFSRTYVFVCARHVLATASYTVNFDIALRESGDQAKPLTFAQSQGIEITPVPFAVTAMAVLFALLGAALRQAIEVTGDGSDFVTQHLPGLLTSAKGAAAMISAAIFYNVYESSELGKNLKMAVGWRSSLLIGSLCGLFNQQILAALGAFIGVKS